MIKRSNIIDKVVETIPQTYPTFAEEDSIPFVSSLLIFAKIIAVTPSTNQPTKKLAIPVILDHVASCDSDWAVWDGLHDVADTKEVVLCVLQPQLRQITASSAISFPQYVQNLILHAA